MNQPLADTLPQGPLVLGEILEEHIEDIVERKLGLLPDDARGLLEIVAVSGSA